MRLPRWMHQLYAFTMDYFWKPCILCGKEFGGHERNDMAYAKVRTRPTGGVTCCPACASLISNEQRSLHHE